MKHSFTILLISVCFITQNTFSQCVSNESNVYAFVYNNTNYEIVKENLNWVDASACAVSRGGFLAEIDTQEEQDSIFFHVNNAGIIGSNTVAPDGGGASYLWIGGNDMNIEGDWIWDGNNDGTGAQFWQGTSSGSPVGGLYNNWGNEPDNFGSGQNGLGFAFTNWPLGVAGQWNDVDDANTLYYIIEYPNGLNIDKEIKTEFNVYPNPSDKEITINIPNELLNITTPLLKIYTVSGELVEEMNSVANQIIIDISSYTNGTYFVKLNDTETIEFIVQH